MENEKTKLVSNTSAIIMYGSLLNNAYPLFDFVEKEKDMFETATVDKMYDLISCMNSDLNNYLIKQVKDE